jgi:regulator of nonsense transcripts 1
MERVAAEQVLRDADVVCCTCVGAGDELLEGFTFRIACVDEATQAPEPVALIPLTKAVAGVLVGDQMQLPPTVTSRKAESCGLGVSLFERLERLGLVPDLLDRQYRMHPALAEWPSKAFYGGRVSSNPTPVDRPPALGLPWPSKTTGQYGRIPMAFVEIDGQERRAPDGLSILNEAEARAAVAVVETLLAASPRDTLVDGMLSVRSPGDIGVIAPYAAQVRRLRELWASSPAYINSAADFSATSDKPGWDVDAEARAERELEVHSVDGFQGREKEVIVLCTVRANSGGSLGFVADDRRLNVAVTRAKRGLVVLGNRATLSSDKTWREWIRWVDKRGLSVKASDFL